MAESHLDPSTPPSSSSDGKRLDSWKEIAAYLHRDVTTVRRWEKREGLPVHRHRHGALGSVYAFTKEIDGWRSGREHRTDHLPEPPPRSGVRPSLVGRDKELDQLHEHLGRALLATRQTVFITGELGIGKTALTQTFLDQVKADVWAAEGQCVQQYGKGEPYLPIVEALDRIIRDARSRDAIAVVEKHAPSWLDQLSLRSQPWHRPHRDGRDEPSAGQMAGELTAAIEALAAVKPLVLLLEDLHWSDQATVEFIARLARRPEPARLLVIGTYRPAELFEFESPLLRVGRELRVHFQANEIELPFLTQEAVGELIARGRTWNDLRGTAASLRRWSGNPLFLIHFLEHLERAGHIIERDGRWSLDLNQQARMIPIGLRMLIEEQVDRLEPEHRRLLEIASVVGETFPAALVAHTGQQDVTLVERSLEDLCKRSPLVTHREVARVPDGTASATYAFVHEFYQQVVYERLPLATLTEMHQRIGRQLEVVYGAHSTEISSELAMHFDRGKDFSRAVTQYCVAADNALARHADLEAQIALSKASELLVQLPSGEDRDQMERQLRIQLGAALGRLGQNSRWMNTDVDHDIVRGEVRDPDLVDAMIRLSRFHAVSGDLVAAKEIGDRAVATGRHRGRIPFEATAQQAYVRLLTGEFTQSRSLVLQALAAADHDGVGESNAERTRCSIVLAWATWYLGHYDDLRSILDRTLLSAEATRRHAVTPSLAPLLEWLGKTDKSVALSRLPNDISISRRSSLLNAPWPPEAVYGWLLVRHNRIGQGVRILRENAHKFRTMAMYSWLPYTLVWLAEGLQINTQFEEALAAAEEGLALVRRTGARWCDAELFRIRGEALMARTSTPATAPPSKGCDAAEASFWASITVARQQDARTLELRSTLSLCRLLREAGRQAEAIRALAPVCELFGKAEGTPDLSDAKKFLNHVSA
jgi:hypothetical protein